MAVAAEVRQIVFEPELQLEKYAHSVRTWRRLGELALRKEDSEELARVEQLSYADFFTGIGEHIKTDPELRGQLDIETCYGCKIINGKVCDVTGIPMVERVEEGEFNAAVAAETDPRMAIQQLRAGGDVRLMRRVDEMPVGTTRFALSMEPKQQLKQDKKFWEDEGYREGIAYLQWYSKDTDDLLEAGAFSIDLSNEEAWRDIFADLGVIVPESISPNEWINYGFELSMDSVAAKQFGLAIRKRYYERMNAQHTRYSINELVTSQEHILKTNFEVYYKRALSPALFSEDNNEILQSFANTLLKANLEKLDPEVRQGLIRIANSQKFDAVAGRLMDSLLQYAVVEELRIVLKELMAGVQPQPSQQPAYTYDSRSIVPIGVVVQHLNQQHASGIEAGVQAGRSYGGCTGLTLTNRYTTELDRSNNPQDVFGGNAAEGNRAEAETDDGDGVCEYITDGCYCCGLNYDGSPSPIKQKVRVYKDSEGVAHCLRDGCGAYLSADGKDYDIGGIARKAQALRSQKKKNNIQKSL